MNKLILTCVLIAIAGSIAAAQTSSMNPPIAKKILKTDTLHGDIRVDNYFWLREKTNPEVINYLNAENAYTESQTKTVQPFGDALYKEFLSRIKQTDLSVPYKLGDYWYYTKTIEGKQYTIYCRKKGSLDAPEEVTLDLNQLAEGHKFLGLGAYKVSDDGNLLAYSTDTTGFRQYYLFIKDLRTGAILPDKFGRVISVEWAADNKNIFYTTDDAAKRPYQLYRHELGGANDQLLYEEKDELYRVFVYRTSDKKYIVLQSASSITTEARYLPANTPMGEWKIMLPREINHEYVVDHHEASFFIRTNKNAKNYKLVAVPDADPRMENWQEILPHRPEVKLEGVNLFASYAVFNERENGLTKLRIMSFATGKITPIDFPEPVYMASPSINPEFVSKIFRFNYQSLVTPSSVFDYDMETGKRTLMKQTEVLGGYDPAQYVSERVFSKAKDGTMVPISLVYKKGVKKDGSAPMLLYGYGSYGFSLPIGFSIPRLSLLDRGVIYAQAHIRGGGDMGEQWRDDGKMMKKKNTFTDFIDCADYLVQQNYTSRERLAIQGGSAGGLLIGAALNMRPDLCKAAHLAVPFVDVINTMLDETLPLTVGEFLEWGNPKKKDEYEYIKTYCPYTNIQATAYPDMLITTSLNDSQVMYWEPAKYTAKMRAMLAGRTDKNVLVLKTNMGAGHGGASGRYDALKEQAFNYAFLMSRIGISK